MTKSERLQKVLAHAGVASRRHAEELIQAGKVKVNGRVVTTLGTRINPERDRVTVEGRVIDLQPQKVYIILNKPSGFLSTRKDPRGRRTVYDLLPEYNPTELHSVGRLDYDSEGLILLTNDGEITYRLTHPSKKIEKGYLADVEFPGGLNPAIIKKLKEGVLLEDGKTAPAKVRILDQWEDGGRLQLTIHEGKYRQIRRMMQALGGQVKRLKRETLGPLSLKGLVLGKSRKLTAQEIKELLSLPQKEKHSVGTIKKNQGSTGNQRNLHRGAGRKDQDQP